MTVLASRNEYVADDDPSRIDVGVVHEFLHAAYWSAGIPRETVERSIANSLCVGVYAANGRMVAFARAVTDRATFGYLADVFVVDSERGAGLGRFVVETMLAHPDVQGLRRWMLVTADAHGLYRSYGFVEPQNPDALMVRQIPAEELYAR